MNQHRAHAPRAAAVALSLLGVVVVAGCSASHSTSRDDAVASVASSANDPSAAQVPASAGSSTTQGRIRSKLFETEQEEQADLVPYSNCMRAHHIMVNGYGRPLGNVALSSVQKKAFIDADQACASSKPLPPIEQDASNPKALSFNRAVAACLRSHGVSPVIIDTSDGYVSIAFGDGATTLGLKYIDTCEHQVAAHNH